MLFPAQSIGVDQPSLHSSGQLSHHGTKSRRLEAKAAECCRIRTKQWTIITRLIGKNNHINRVLKECLAYYSATQRHISLTNQLLFTYESKGYKHSLDAALVASSLYIIQLECFSSFFSLKSEVTFIEAVKSGGQHVKWIISSQKKQTSLLTVS